MKRWVFTGAGHTQVLRDRALAPFPDLERNVVPSHALTADLAMAPGWLARSYRPEQNRPDRKTIFLSSNMPISQTSRAQSAINSVAKIPYFLHSVVASQTDCAVGVAAAKPHRTQREFLVLLETAHGEAIASRCPLGAGGTWTWRWKNRIYRRFIARFAMPLTSSSSPSIALESDTP